ncbi:MAG: nucleotide exchange factor GrpE, partial [Planctomycetota bacterium]
MSTTDEHNEINDGQLDPELIEDHLDEEGGEGVEGEHDGQQSLENQLADWEEKYQRALADYQNFQRRARENEERAREQGASDILKSLIPVLDNCQLALMLDPETTSAEQVLGGVKGIVDQFFASLERHGLAPIRPEAGDEFNPGHHEAMLRV